MQRLRHLLPLVFVFAVLALVGLPFAFLAFAQAPVTPPAAMPTTFDIGSLLALFINTVGTLGAVQVLKTYVMPGISTSMPALLPILAGLMGPLLAFVQTSLAAKLGYPIDLSAVVAIFSGAAAVGVNQVVKQSTAPTNRLRKLVG